MEERLLETVAERILASRRGERPPDPAEQEGLACLADLAGQRLGSPAGRRAAAGGWARDELSNALAELAAENEAVGRLILRLGGPVGERRRDRSSLAGPTVGTGNRVSQNLRGGVGIAVGGNLHVGGSDDPLVALRSLRSLAGDTGPEDRRGAGPLPDLELRVAQSHDAGGLLLDVELLVHDPGTEPGRHRAEPVRLQGDPKALVHGLFREIESSGAGRCLESALAAIGGDLSRRLLPERLSRLLWDLRHHDRTLLLCSDEPWLPWELVRLRSPSGELGPFLCEAFSMTRWLDGCLPPTPALPLRRMAVVACRIGDPLAVSAEEAELLARDGAARSVQRVAARYEPLVEALAAGGYDGWHFCGHGAASALDPNAATLPLEDYRCLIARDLAGEARGCGPSRPLVFLNACHLGRGGWALTGIGGWAEQSLAVGAGAFVGASWGIDGEAAAAFASTFYQRFCDQGVPFGKSIRQAREAIRNQGDATWLAYVSYGHPRASR